MLVNFVLLVVSFTTVLSIIQPKINFIKSEKDVARHIWHIYGGDLATAAFDIIRGIPENKITVCFDTTTDTNFIQILLLKLERATISVMIFNLTSVDGQEKYFEYLSYQTENYRPSSTIFFGTHKLYEHILLEIYDRNFIRQNLIYIFNWGQQPFQRYFQRNIHHAMKVFAITNPRNDTVYYNQATSYREHHLDMVNWWNQDKGLFSHPTLPQKKSVYKDFHGKIFQVPVLHKPPWHFVKYFNASANKTFEVMGGRDDRILSLLSKKLNFRYNYSDPPERIQGSASSDTGSFNGVLGLIARREADLFIGDVGITYERFGVVQFSFLTLADSGAFVTHAPSRLNEALALLRPFQWQVWPAIGVTCLIVGPFLYTLIALPNTWQPRFIVRSHARLFFDCTWFTVTILLKQTGREPSSTNKARFFIILLSISATYVITDMYSANLTSLLARPGRERAINNLYQLKAAMESRDYKLYVEKHGPSFGLLEVSRVGLDGPGGTLRCFSRAQSHPERWWFQILRPYYLWMPGNWHLQNVNAPEHRSQNGTGIYGQIWELMETEQDKFVIDSVEEGVKLVRDRRNLAVMAGRETLFFDIQRFGPKNYHLSEKLNTAYSAIALQVGCPYIEEINKILAAMFEAGIITKMTENEYEKLGKQKGIINIGPELDVPTTKTETKRAAKVSEDNEKLKPISLKMLQGSFYLLVIGNIFSGLVLTAEIFVNKYKRSNKRQKKYCLSLKKIWRQFKYRIKMVQQYLVRMYRSFMHDAFTHTLEYIE